MSDRSHPEPPAREPGQLDSSAAGRPAPLPPLASSPESERDLLLSVYLRSLALQGSWNSQRMQNLGLLVALLPLLRRLSPSHFERRRFIRRHFEFFNTNPYLANSLVGGLLRLEDGHARGQVPVSLIRTFKNTLARSTASVGDQLFWLGLKPATLLIMVILVMQGFIAAVPVVIGLYVLGQLVFRWQALMAGFRLGLDIVDWLARPVWHLAIAHIKRAGMIATGVLAGCYVSELMAEVNNRIDWSLFAAVILTASVPFFFRHRLGGEGALLIVLPLALALAAI